MPLTATTEQNCVVSEATHAFDHQRDQKDSESEIKWGGTQRDQKDSERSIEWGDTQRDQKDSERSIEWSGTQRDQKYSESEIEWGVCLISFVP